MKRAHGIIALFVTLCLTGVAHADEQFTIRGHTYTFKIEAEHSDGYDRNDWPHWNTRVGGGCFNVRDKVLAEESYLPVVTDPINSSGRCKVTHGVWHDPYTGESFSSSTQVQIDHMVPLKEAYESGGHAWTRERRRDYANDLDYSYHLIAVKGSENGSKGAGDPAEYLPIEAFQCKYVEIWITIKDRWGLNMDQAEADAIKTVLAGC